MEYNAEGLSKLGTSLKRKLDVRKSDRVAPELQWLRNLRQYRATYDPEVTLEPDRSKVYPRDSRAKLIGFVAKMMELMFPAHDKNWAVEPTEKPNIPVEALKEIVAKAQMEKMQTAMAAQVPPEPLTEDEITVAINKYARDCAAAVEAEIEDQLEDKAGSYIALCKRVVHSGGLYSFGVVRGPETEEQLENEYVQDATGEWVIKQKKKVRARLTNCRIWTLYPDFSAPTWEEQEGMFEEYIFTRHDLSGLRKRKDFIKEKIEEVMDRFPEGNYDLHTYDAELNKLGDNLSTTKTKRGKYQAYRYYGFVSARDMMDAGIDIPEAQKYDDILVDIWFIDNIVIKAEKAVFGDSVADQYHAYFYDDEYEAGLLGTSLMETIRDTQLKLAAVDRMLMDNAAASCGPMLEVNEAKLSRKSKGNLRIGAFSTIYTDDDVPNSTGAVKDIQINNHVPTLLNLRKHYEEQLDKESNLPSWTLGAAPQQLGEAFRTSMNMSQMTGGANMVTKDQVRAFDRFTTSLMTSMVKFIRQFNKDDKKIQGCDLQVMARGTMSLVAKEVRGAALDQLAASLSPREMVLVRTEDFLMDRFKSRDLPVNYIKTGKEAAEALAQFDQQQAQAAGAAQAEQQAKTGKLSAEAKLKQAQAQEVLQSIQAKVEAMVADTEHKLQQAKGAKNAEQRESLKLLLEQLQGLTPETGGGTTAQPSGAEPLGISA